MSLPQKTKLIEKDFSYLTILIALSLVIGIYLIVTTVMVSKDGVLYMQLAQQFGSDPVSVIKSDPPFGLPVLVFAFHNSMKYLISNTVQSWELSGQIVNLICKTLAFIPLFFLGKRLVGPRDSFLGLLILVFLPYPAEMGSDILRDWPHLLFLMSGLLFLWKGFEEEKWWYFSLAAIAAGLGQMIRPEAAQIIIFGLIWIIVLLFSSGHKTCSKFKPVLWGISLIVPFLIISAPYWHIKGEVLPGKWQDIFDFSAAFEPSAYCTAGAGDYINGVGRMLQALSEGMMYFFFPFALLGIGFYIFRNKSAGFKTFIISALLTFYTMTLTLLFVKAGYISGRHILPVLIILVFFVPKGLFEIAAFLNRKKSEPLKQKESLKLQIILLTIGILICLPKLAKPINADKKHFLQAAKWLNENTPQDAHIATFDRRIGFYAERSFWQYEKDFDPFEADGWIVTDAKKEEGNLEMNREPVKQFSSNKSEVLIYRNQ